MIHNKSIDDLLYSPLTLDFFNINEEDFKDLRPTVTKTSRLLIISEFSPKTKSINPKKLLPEAESEIKTQEPAEINFQSTGSWHKDYKKSEKGSNSGFYAKNEDRADFDELSLHGSYEVQGELLIQLIQNTLKSEYSMVEHFLPNEEEYKNSAKSNIFMTENISNPSALLILIQGAGHVRAGIWSRSVCLKDDLDTGSMIPLVEFAKSQNWVTLILNPNLTHDPSTHKSIPLLETREKHGRYVWEKFVQTNSLPFYIVAHSCGGMSVSDLVRKYPEDFKARLAKLAFTDAVVSDHDFSSEHRAFIARKSVHWVASQLGGNRIISKAWQRIEERSAGHTQHEYATGSAFKYIIDYFLEN